MNSDNGTVLALRAYDGSEIWHANIGVGDHSDGSPAVANGILYVGNRNGLYAFQTVNGSQIWFFTSPFSPRQYSGYVYSCPAVDGNVVYYGFSDGYVFALNASDGSMVWAYRTGIFVFASPAIVNGTVYVGSYDSYLYALGGSSAPTPIPNPKPTTTPNPTPLPSTTATPAPSPTPQPTANPTSTITPTTTLTAAPPKMSITQPTTRPITAKINEDVTVNWILLAFVAIAIIALISLFAVYKVGNEDRELNRRRF